MDGNGFKIPWWKQRVDRFRGIYWQLDIDDGTIAGHFLLDEADDKSNWNGKIVPVELIEEMARYSKEIWLTMPTIVRAFSPTSPLIPTSTSTSMRSGYNTMLVSETSSSSSGATPASRSSSG